MLRANRVAIGAALTHRSSRFCTCEPAERTRKRCWCRAIRGKDMLFASESCSDRIRFIRAGARDDSIPPTTAMLAEDGEKQQGDAAVVTIRAARFRFMIMTRSDNRCLTLITDPSAFYLKAGAIVNILRPATSAERARLACWRWRPRHRELFLVFDQTSGRSIKKSSFWRDASRNQHARRARYQSLLGERPALAADSGAASVSCGVSEWGLVWGCRSAICGGRRRLV